MVSNNDMTVEKDKVLLKVHGLKMHFPVKGGVLLRAQASCKAVDGVSLSIADGETLGLVGESGCGKSTLGKSIVRLLNPTEGKVVFEGQDITEMGRRELLPLRRNLQMIFQDPAESLNSRHMVRDILEEPFIIHGIGNREERRERVDGLLKKVGLNPAMAVRFPFEFSGGQRQRIALARVILKDAPVLVLDEATSALDSEVEAAIQTALDRVMEDKTVIAIAHRLSTIARMDRIVVLEAGQIVEAGTHSELLAAKGTYARYWDRQSGGFIGVEDLAAE